MCGRARAQTRVKINNESSHDVHAIRISAKQVVRARFSSGDEEKYKCQVALLETDRFCPVKKNNVYSQRFAVTPELLPTEVRPPGPGQLGHIGKPGRIGQPGRGLALHPMPPPIAALTTALTTP